MLKLDLQFFGGRGSSSGGGLPTATPNGSAKPNGNGKWSSAPNTQSPDTLKEALGKKGRPMSIENAVRGEIHIMMDHTESFPRPARERLLLMRQGAEVIM